MYHPAVVEDYFYQFLHRRECLLSWHEFIYVNRTSVRGWRNIRELAPLVFFVIVEENTIAGFADPRVWFPRPPHNRFFARDLDERHYLATQILTLVKRLPRNFFFPYLSGRAFLRNGETR